MTLVSPALPDLRPRTVPARISAVRIPGLGTWMLRRAAKLTARQRVAVTLRDVYFDPEAMHPDRLAEEIAEIERQDTLGYVSDALLKSANGVVSEYLRCGPAALWREAAQITAEVLAIYGSHDRLVDPRTVGRAARTFQHVRVVVLPRTGHVGDDGASRRSGQGDADHDDRRRPPRGRSLPALPVPSGELPPR